MVISAVAGVQGATVSAGGAGSADQRRPGPGQVGRGFDGGVGGGPVAAHAAEPEAGADEPAHLQAMNLTIGRLSHGVHLPPGPPQRHGAGQVPHPGAEGGAGAPGPARHQSADGLRQAEREGLRHDPQQVEPARTAQQGPHAITGLVPGTGPRLPVAAHPGIGGHDHPGARSPSAPAEAEIVVRRTDRLVEPGHGCEPVRAYQREAGREREHLTHAVVLSLVQLAAFDQRHRGAHPVHAEADVQQTSGVVPSHELGPHHVGVPLGGGPDECAHGTRVRENIVAAEREELRPASPGPVMIEDVVGGSTEALGTRDVQDPGGGHRGADPVGSVVGLGGVDDQHGQLGVVLLGEGPQQDFEPVGVPSVRDHDRQNRWGGELLLLRFHDDAEGSQGPVRSRGPSGPTTSHGPPLASAGVPRPSTDDISRKVENTLYTAVGLGILGFQHLQVQRQQLKRAIENALKKPKR